VMLTKSAALVSFSFENAVALLIFIPVAYCDIIVISFSINVMIICVKIIV